MSSTATRVGFIGLGNMGRPLARNVLRAGFELSVWNRTRSRCDELAARGARVAGSPAELARDADVVLCCLATVAACREVLLGDGGVIAAAREGQLIADHSTVDLATSLEVHEAARARGARFLDAPVSGGPEGAENATLSVLAGGEEGAFERAAPVLRAMGRTVRRLGGPGAGTVAKLANQLLVGVHTLAACEALVLARRAGVDLRALADVLGASWGASRMLERNAPAVIDRSIGPSGAPLRNLHKDLGIVLELAREKGIETPSAAAAARVFAGLVAAGRGDQDIAAAALAVDRGVTPPEGG